MARTVAIIDFAHSGTTMVARLCDALGVPMMGERCKERKMEDLDVYEAIKNEEKFAKLVEARNRQFLWWGFKVPGAWKYPRSLTHLRNPVFLVIYKDPISVTARRFGGATLNKLDNTLEQMRISTQGILELNLPVYLLCYQKAILAPEIFVTELARMLCIEVGDRLPRAVEIIRPGVGYPRWKKDD